MFKSLESWRGFVQSGGTLWFSSNNTAWTGVWCRGSMRMSVWVCLCALMCTDTHSAPVCVVHMWEERLLMDYSPHLKADPITGLHLNLPLPPQQLLSLSTTTFSVHLHCPPPPQYTQNFTGIPAQTALASLHEYTHTGSWVETSADTNTPITRISSFRQNKERKMSHIKKGIWSFT